MTEFDVFGLGNSLMDIMIKVDDSHLVEFDLKKGTFHLFENEKVEEILLSLKDREHKLVPAGGVGNTIMGLANLGAKCVMCGKIGQDEHGEVYEKILTSDKIKCNLGKCGKDSTGRVVNLVTPDAERTFAVNLGASINIEKDEVLDEDIAGSKMFYFTGYEFESVKETVLHALDIAKDNGVKIALDLADPLLVKRHLEDIKLLLKSCDIVFMNETEAFSLTGLDPEDTVVEIGQDVDVVVVKVGEKGSLVHSQGSTIKVESFLKKAVDTTGAGDLYASGFLYGLMNDKPLELCGKYGSYMASKIVEVIGGRLDCCVKEEVDKLV